MRLVTVIAIALSASLLVSGLAARTPLSIPVLFTDGQKAPLPLLRRELRNPARPYAASSAPDRTTPCPPPTTRKKLHDGH